MKKLSLSAILAPTDSVIPFLGITGGFVWLLCGLFIPEYRVALLLIAFVCILIAYLSLVKSHMKEESISTQAKDIKKSQETKDLILTLAWVIPCIIGGIWLLVCFFFQDFVQSLFNY